MGQLNLMQVLQRCTEARTRANSARHAALFNSTYAQRMPADQQSLHYMERAASLWVAGEALDYEADAWSAAASALLELGNEVTEHGD